MKFRLQSSKFLVSWFALVFAAAPALHAQIQMPDPKQMSGIPRPVDDLPAGSVSVRLIKGDLSNNIAGHPVEMHVGDKVLTVKTDEDGRAQFDKLPAGATLKASADVEGEHLESQEFPAPAQGGVRLMLVATDKEKEARAAAEASAPATPGQVAIAGESRLVIEPGDETLQLYYMLDIENTARTPVNPPSVFAFDMPTGCTGTSLLEGSSPRAKVNGTHVMIESPFPPGATMVQVGCELPVTSGSLTFEQRFPAVFEHLGMIARKEGDMRLTSPQVTRQQDMPAQSDVYIAAAGEAVAAEQPIQVTISGLPHHSAAPRWIALVLAVGVLLAGVVGSARRPEVPSKARAERQRLMARRDKLFQDLVRLETEHREHRVDAARYVPRREQLLAALEEVYGALDTDDTSPEPADRSGLAA